MQLYILIALTMLAFASNSILGRMALGDRTIDPASFTAIRLASGACMLILIQMARSQAFRRQEINGVSALMLFTYAICFSFSYVDIPTGTGALILFGTVQLSLVGYGLLRGERPRYPEWIGMVLAFSGLVYLLLPGVSAPPLFSALLMMAAGIAWGVYTIRGQTADRPLVDTTWNFTGTLPLVLLTWLLFHEDSHVSAEGVLLAVLSGAVASALGYAVWYSILPRLAPTRAATVQLSVPVIAAFGGVVLLAEPVTLRLAIASVVVLTGVYMIINTRSGRVG